MDNKMLVVSKNELISNIQVLKKEMGAKIIAVLKGDGYGLSLISMAEILKSEGIDFFAVSEYTEAIKLRENGFLNEDILLLTPQYDDEIIAKLINLGIILTVDSYENGKKYSLCAIGEEKSLRAHIKVDTGFGRFGFQVDNKEEIIKTLKLTNVEFEGIYSHFSCSFEKKYKITKKQFDKFISILNYLKEFDIDFKIKHIANSCGALRFPETRLDAVRLGSALLGRLPVSDNLGLKKIGYLESNVLCVKTLPSGSNVGYANTYKTGRVTDIAVIPVGYKDGFMTIKADDTFRIKDVIRYIVNNLRSTGKRTFVDIKGNKVPLIGRVGMYNIVADVTGTDVKEGDKVILNINPLLVNSSIKREYR